VGARAAIEPDPIDGDPRLRAGLVIWLCALFLLLLRSSWLKWGDPIIDTGRELEIPWKVARGQLLYRDMAYNYGPLSPLFHGLLFKLFGVRLAVVTWSGIAAAAGGTALVWHACRGLAGRIAACAVAAVFLFECAFQHYMPNGIFNFVLPYSFPAVHGTLLALGAFGALANWTAAPRRGRLAAAGVLAGLSLLCKIEMACAMLVPLFLLPALAAWKDARRRRGLVGDQLAWLVPCAMTTVAGFAPFVFGSSFGDVVWRNVLRPQLVDVRSNLFFMTHLGLADLRTNLWRIGVGIVAWAAALTLLGLTAALLDGPLRSRGGRKVLGLVVLGATCALGWRWLPPGLEFAALSAIGCGVTLACAWRLASRAGPADPRTLQLLALALFATLALLRMFLTAGTFHYGFYLAVPALILFGIVLFAELPRAVPFLARRRVGYETALACFLIVLSVRSFYLGSLPAYGQKTIVLSGTQGTMLVSATPYGVTSGEYLRDALSHLQTVGRAGDTLLVLPEGATINFLSGQVNPTYYDVLIPPELEAPGVEDALIGQIDTRGVDRILFVERTVAEYGRRGLGLDYGLKLMRYLGEHYAVEATFGPPPYGPTPGGCVVLRRRG
jgi:hypothetical protein